MTTITVNYTVDHLEEALRFYADRARYLHEDRSCADICHDEGEIAREALKALKAES